MFTFSLPTEVLLDIFKEIDSLEWQRDLLSFAQVSRQWSCSLTVLFARLGSGACPGTTQGKEFLDHCAFANALRAIPVLADDVHHLNLKQHVCENWYEHPKARMREFTSTAIAIFRVTRNLQRLDLSLGYSSQANTLFSTLPRLHDLQTLSITLNEPDSCQFMSVWLKYYWEYTISTSQLAWCMARWPTLRSLTVERIRPGNIGMRKITLRRPTCALTQLSIHRGHISDKDLLYLTASSTSTLTQVSLQDIDRLTNRGLFTFLNAISETVVSLTVHKLSGFPLAPKEEPALDVVVATMPRLQALAIQGNVATQRMLYRRSNMFVKSGSGVPVVRLSRYPDIGEDDAKWPGWQLTVGHPEAAGN